MRQLINSITLTPVALGDSITSFRGEVATVTYIPPRGNKVCVVWAGDPSDSENEYYPSVFDLKYTD